MTQSSGKLYGISVGPGDPELITLKGYRLLQSADVVAFPAGIGDKPGIAEQIISPWLSPDQQTLPLHFPYSPEPQSWQLAWHTAAQKLLTLLNRDHTIAFACEGDISLYSTFTYLAQALGHLAPQIAIEIVPGVSSPQAAAAVLGMPLTFRHQRLMMLPALYAIAQLSSILAQTDTLILLKINQVYEQIWNVLNQQKLLRFSRVVEHATGPNQKIYDQLQHYPQLDLSYFSIMIIQCQPESTSTTIV